MKSPNGTIPVGAIFGTGYSKDLKTIAYTVGKSPHFIMFNYSSGTYNNQLDNIYNFMSVIKHELFHRANYRASPPIDPNLFTHIDVYLAQFEDISYSKTTDIFKLVTIRSMTNYLLNMDKKRNPDNSFKYKKSDIKDKIDTFNNLNLRYKLVYPMTDWTQGSLTIGIKDMNNYLNTPEDANESYYELNEK